jgi:hypothetical protein
MLLNNHEDSFIHSDVEGLDLSMVKLFLLLLC